MIRFAPHVVLVLGAWSFFAPATCRAQQKSSSEQFTFFEKKIRPILVEHCYRCHSTEAAKGGKVKGGLQLDTRDGLRAGGHSGPAIVPGNPGRTEGSNGRDHNHWGFTVWLAGGGVKGGLAYGATDEFGFRAVEKRVHVHDLHATMLHLLGIDHERLTFRYSGRDHRLTDVHGTVLHDLMA